MTRMTWAVCGVVALRNLACCGLRRAAFVCFAWLVLVAWPTTRGEPNVGLSDALADAELTDLFFLDPEHGWAVGDRGAIWSTSDGGRQWRRRESPSGCRWESVWFADSQHGWIVGGWHQPATGQSRGAVLRTRDGGQNWMPVPASTLPRLLKVRFSDSQRGWAVGEPTPLYPTGVFRSEDGGRSWAPVPGPACGQWLTGDWLAKPGRTRLGIVAGRHGSVAQLAADGLAPQVVPAASGRSIRAITLATATEPQRGFPSWLVGDDGLVLSSYDGGRSWLEPPTPPPLACGQVDWRGVAALDGRVWIVGDPGSVVLHSADGGESWQLLRTDESAPLRSVRFFDRQRGWAVGALGQILATRDGGQTWKRAQGRGRVALLGLFSDESRLPLELFAQTAGNDGYLAVAELLFHRDLTSASSSTRSPANVPANSTTDNTTVETTRAPAYSTANVAATARVTDWLGDAHRHSLAARVHAALLEAGASGGGVLERFPVEDRGLEPTAERLVAAWNERFEGRGFERLVEQLTTKLRTWRPEVVVTEDTVGDGADALTG
ncbi:MAG: WD40/YVTN/BNR-like repeat-containing protein, partial [Planctomycetota bacterium]